MVKFVDVDPNEIQMISERRRGRVSYPILKSFLETGKYAVMLDRTGMSQSLMNLTTSLNTYIKNHDLPVKVLQRRSQIYLLRLDLDEEGNKISDWKEKIEEEGTLDPETAEPPKPITAGEVAKCGRQERNKVTK